ncbi:MAG: GntR family transcriptional regulator [Pseudomonadota bacterium]
MQVSESLIRDIGAGRLVDGERLLPERDMARELGISVGTLRKALADLDARGLLERVQGSGNYIKASDSLEGIYAYFRLELLEGGGLPTADVLDIQRLEKPGSIPSFGSSHEGHRIRRMRRLNDLPAAVEEIWLDGNYATRLNQDAMLESLYLYYHRELDLLITQVEDRVSVGQTPGWAPNEFGLKAGSPAGLVERFSQSSDGTIAEYSRNWFDPGRARYVSRMRS